MHSSIARSYRIEFCVYPEHVRELCASRPPFCPISRTRVPSGSEFVVFLEHVCEVRSSWFGFALFLEYVWCSRSSSEFVVLFEHVSEMQPFQLRIRRISRTRVQRAAARAPNSSYFSNTCAKCCGLSSGFVVFLEHVCKVQPASRPDRSRVWTSGTLVWEAVRLIHGCN